MKKSQEGGCWRCGGKGWFEKSNRPGRKVTCQMCERRRMQEEEMETREAALRERRSRFKVGIVGSGIGGLASALALGRLGFHVVVYERDSTFDERKQGYGLTLQQGFNAMKFLGLEIPGDTPSTSHFAFDEHGKILGYFGSEFSKYFEEGESFSKKKKGKFNGQGRFNCHIPRQHLRFMLLEAVEREQQEKQTKVTIRWGAKVSSVDHADEQGGVDGKQVRVSFESEEAEFCDMLVAADGIYSSVRNKVLGDGLNFLGCVVVLGISPLRHPLTHERVCETMDGETRIYSMPFTSVNGQGIKTDPQLAGKDSIMWQLSFPVADEEKAKDICRSNESLKEEALRRCGNWHAPIPQLLSETSPSLLSGHPVYDRPELDADILETAFEKQNLGDGLAVFIGDSAHCMSPFKGQGANQALLDATELAKLMERSDFFENRGALMKEFHRSMCARSAPKVRGSREAAKLLHTPMAKVERQESDGEEDPLVRAGVSALTPEDLNNKVVQVCGFGHRPHMLHQVKIERSRMNDN